LLGPSGRLLDLFELESKLIWAYTSLSEYYTPVFINLCCLTRLEIDQVKWFESGHVQLHLAISLNKVIM